MLGEADFVAIAKSGRAADLLTIDRRAILGRNIVQLNRQIAVNDNRAMAAGNGCIINHHIIVWQTANAVQTDLQGDLLAAVEQPAMGAGGLDRNITWGKCFEVAGFGTEGQANFAGEGVSAGRVFDAASCGAKCIASCVTFEMDAQQPWIHGELPFPSGRAT